MPAVPRAHFLLRNAISRAFDCRKAVASIKSAIKLQESDLGGVVARDRVFDTNLRCWCGGVIVYYLSVFGCANHEKNQAGKSNSKQRTSSMQAAWRYAWLTGCLEQLIAELIKYPLSLLIDS